MRHVPKEIILTAAHTEKLLSEFRVVPDTGCWNWFGSRGPKGYGKLTLTVQGVAINYAAHRYSYVLRNGPVPGNLDLDHTCVNTRCINPDHLEPVTMIENLARVGVRNRAKSHCKWGHPRTPENLHVTPQGKHTCKRCTLIPYRARQLRLRFAEYMVNEVANDALFARSKRDLPPREGTKKLYLDWTNPLHCTVCQRPMRHHSDKPDGQTVSHGARGVCGTCYRRGHGRAG